MGRLKILKLMMIASLAPVYKTALGADVDPVGKKIDNAQVMNRVALVGVIAGGSAASGVAVIKDSQTGRTYAIKTGDNLPGVGHIKLRSVKRELAVFDVEGKEYQVRLSVGGYAQDAEDDEDLDADIAQEHEGPGLFEKWHSVGLVTEDRDGKEIGKRASENEAPSSDSTNMNRKRNHTTIAVDSDNLEKAAEAEKLRQDHDGPVTTFLDDLTNGVVADGKLRKKIDAANAAKNKTEALNVNGAVNTGAAE